MLAKEAGTQNFVTSNNSIFTLAMIAVSKLLSPSHAQQSISLFTTFKEWCEENTIPETGFKGFQANRFGRYAETARLFLRMGPNIQRFFNEIVDDSANLLVKAVAQYITNDWVKVCAEVYTVFGELLISP